jgi:hypothetical protein
MDMLNFTSSPQRTTLIDLGDPMPNSAPDGSTPVAPFAPQQLRSPSSPGARSTAATCRR